MVVVFLPILCLILGYVFFFFLLKTAYEFRLSHVGSGMCIRVSSSTYQTVAGMQDYLSKADAPLTFQLIADMTNLSLIHL